MSTTTAPSLEKNMKKRHLEDRQISGKTMSQIGETRLSKNMRRSRKHWCFIPNCKNTAINAPNKLFLNVPLDPTVRKSWILAVGRNVRYRYSLKTRLSCCEDHFDLEEDVDNWTYFKLMGGHLRLKAGVVPHKFHCQYSDMPPKKAAELLRRRGKKMELRKYISKVENTEENQDEDTHFFLEAYVKEEPEELDSDEQVYNEDPLQLQTENDKERNMGKHEDIKTENFYEISIDDTQYTNNTVLPDMNTENSEETDYVETKSFSEICIKEEPIDMHDEITPHTSVADNRSLESIYLSSNCEYKRVPIKGELKVNNAVEYWDNETKEDNTCPSRNVHPNFCTVPEVKFDILTSDSFALPQTHKQVGANVIKCKDCNEIFSTKRQLHKHCILHNTERKFKCAHCSKCFHSKINIKKHVLIHNIKNIKCNVCGKLFTQRRLHNLHMFIHVGIKKFNCNVCEKRFVKKTELIKHFMWHTGIKNYRCEVCDKKYTTKSDLNKHSLIHKGARNFKCEICSRQFVQNGALKTHMLVHVGIKKYECKLCGKHYTQKGTLKRHIKFKH